MDATTAVHDLTAEIKEIARREGASLVGVSTPERFDGAPRGHHPRDFIPGVRSVITFGMRILRPVVDWPRYLQESDLIPAELRQDVLLDYLYIGSGYNIINDRLNQIALTVGTFLEECGHRSIFFPATYGHALGLLQKAPDLLGVFSQRHAAVRAGLGEFGLNNVVVTPQYGPRVRFNSVITEAPLDPDPLLLQKACRGQDCRICVDGCPAAAITLLPAATSADVCLHPVSRTDRAACRSQRGKGECMGKCIRVCPVGASGGGVQRGVGP